jgi:succinate dehydrogenase / fumarate reductase iron-sulfur subunit
MNIDGTNTIACTKAISDIKGAVRIYPLPHLPVIKDLVPDMTDFFAPASAASCRITLRTLPFGRISRPIAFLGMSDFFA